MRKSLIATVVTGAAALAAASVVAAAPASAHSTPSCTGAQLQVSHTRPQGATGHANTVLLFKNVGHRICSLRGYPGVDAIGPHGGVLAHAMRTLHGFTGGARGVRTLYVSPAHFASADLEWMNFGPHGGNCRFSHSVALTPPNTSKTVYRPVSVSTCSLQIHPVVYGKTGNSH